MEKYIYYNEDGWVCKRHPNNFEITDENRYIIVDEDTYKKTFICEAFYAWSVVDGELKKQKYSEPILLELLEEEKYAITSWLYQNDWKINKVFIGEWSANDQRWLDYLSERTIKRNRLDEINLSIEQEKLNE
jgi:hypothetical protein